MWTQLQDPTADVEGMAKLWAIDRIRGRQATKLAKEAQRIRESRRDERDVGINWEGRKGWAHEGDGDR